MCTLGASRFVKQHLSLEDVAGKRVLEVGSYNVNGSVRQHVEDLKPASYLGVDIARGPGVDEVCDATELVERFGEGTFDVVITTEMVEHVEHWREVFHNLKHVVAPGGVLVVTTRSRGFGFHAHPFDFWRYEPDDMRVIFSDFDVELLERDRPDEPGVLVRARRPDSPRDPSANLSAYALHSIITNRRELSTPRAAKLGLKLAVPFWRTVKRVFPARTRLRIRGALGDTEPVVSDQTPPPR